jgi:hypothetical protein
MNLKAMAVITSLTLATGLNFPILAANNPLIPSDLGQTTSSFLNSAIAQAQKPTDTMSNPNHTTDSMKKPTGNATKKPVSDAMSSPNSAGDAMKKPTGDAMTKPKG